MFSFLDISEVDQHPHHDEGRKDCPDVPLVTSFDTVLKNSCSVVYKKNCSIQNLTLYEEERCSNHYPCSGRSSDNYKIKCQGGERCKLENI